MDSKPFELAGDIEHGEALYVAADAVLLPPEIVDEHELVYRIRKLQAFGAGSTSLSSFGTTPQPGNSSSR